ncbi:MAG TPA: putative quinol monooxygenase [Acidimicrobiales bacterium]|nr:putative quinol monooxygenase [Acidimicrobiales bacterium]
MPPIAVHAKLTAQPGKRDELVTALQELVEATQSEPGTLVYALHTSDSDENAVWFYELYPDQDARDVHGRSETMKAIGPKLAGLLGAMPELSAGTVVGSKGLPG